MNRAGFLLDLDRCVGCGACVLACRIENDWPPGVSWRRILSLNLARNAGGPTYHLSVACHHCERPVCLKACPSGAYEQRRDGRVILNTERCLGCHYCEMACPFGAPAFDETSGVMTKCDFCSDRVERDLSPACIEACPTGALILLPDGAGAEKEAALPVSGPESTNVAEVPGFIDPADCRPSLQFRRPGGCLRTERMERLLEVLGW